MSLQTLKKLLISPIHIDTSLLHNFCKSMRYDGYLWKGCSTFNYTLFDPSNVLVPALYQLAQLYDIHTDESYVQLWEHTSRFLLNRSEYTPEPPKDWSQDIKISCDCEDCRALQTFLSEPASQLGRFRIAKERRQHLHQIIEKYNMDIIHITEHKGSPHTLVCTKTRKTYEARCAQYKKDILCMETLLPLLPKELSAIAELRNRLIAAIARANK